MNNFINKTGYVISLHVGEKFITLYPNGKACEIIEEYENQEGVDLIYKRLKNLSISNFPDENDKIVIVNKNVAYYCFFNGINNVIYLDGGYLRTEGNSISSKILVKVH